MLNNKTLFPLLLFIISLFVSCNDSSTGPYTPPYGVKGTIIDTLGNPIQNVQIYCTFFEEQIDTSEFESAMIRKFIHPDSLMFSLQQNYPNPFYNSTFFRFSIPKKCSVTYSVAPLNSSGSPFYSNNSDLMPGLYQIYLEKLAQKFNLVNGFYTLSLKATADDKTTFSGSINMLLISDAGAPSAASGQDGNYFFDYGSISKADSVMLMYDPDGKYSYYLPLNKNVTLLFRKEGYKDKYTSFSLYPDLTINSDIIMMKKEN